MLFLWGDGAATAAAASGLRRVAEPQGGSSSQPQASHLACAASSVSSVHAEQARGFAAERPSGERSVVSAGVGGAGAGSAACSVSDSSSGSVVPPSEDPQLAEASAARSATAAAHG